MKIGLISENADANTHRLEDELSRRKVRVRTLWLGNDAISYSVDGGPADIRIKSESGWFSSEDFAESGMLMLVGLHRHNLVTGTSLDFAAREWNSTLLNAAAIWEQSSRRNWAIGKNARSLVDSKLFLLHELGKAGASVPPYAIRTEIPSGTIREDFFVAKAVNAWEEIAPGNYFNTRKVSLADARHLELPSRPQGPIFLQQFARHRREIRIFIVRNSSFGVEITSRDEDVPDFRLLDGASAYARIIEASESTVRILKGLTERLGIEYVAADVIVDDDDREWIVDFNPLGVWDYLEDDFDLCLTGLIADGIIDHVN